MAFNIFATATSSIPLANLDANFTAIGTSAAASTLYPTATTSITYGASGAIHLFDGNVGIGTSSPNLARLDIRDTVAGNFYGLSVYNLSVLQPSGILLLDGSSNASITTTGNGGLKFSTAGASVERMRIDSSGNLGLGVTPSAWQGSPINAMQIGSAMSLSGYSSSANRQANIWCNAYVNGSGVNTYINTDAASAYRQLTGTHAWYTAPSGTSGSAVSFSEVMRIDSSGNVYGTSGTTTMTNGFFYIPSAGGAPSGTPTAVTGRVPMYYDTTNNQFYVYNGAWKKVTLA